MKTLHFTDDIRSPRGHPTPWYDGITIPLTINVLHVLLSSPLPLHAALEGAKMREKPSKRITNGPPAMRDATCMHLTLPDLLLIRSLSTVKCKGMLASPLPMQLVSHGSRKRRNNDSTAATTMRFGLPAQSPSHVTIMAYVVRTRLPVCVTSPPIYDMGGGIDNPYQHTQKGDKGSIEIQCSQNPFTTLDSPELP